MRPRTHYLSSHLPQPRRQRLLLLLYRRHRRPACRPPTDLTTDIACFGTVSLVLEPGVSRYATLLKNLHQDGTFIALDPNIRPFYATKAHSDFLYSLLPSVDLLKLSDEEEEFLDHPEAPIKVITCGPDGMIVHFNGQTIEVNAPTIEVADTIGTGDTVIGCLLAEIHRRTGGKNVRSKVMEFVGEDWAEIASYAARAEIGRAHV